jgi:hypothetical protein
MNVERTDAGLEAQLRIAGIGRFIGVAFLTFWLTGWVIGEAVALWLLGKGSWSLFTGQLLNSGQKSTELSAALAAGLFLVVWLVLWTVGGVAAFRELLRLLFGRDTVRAGTDGLAITRRSGIFRSITRIPRDTIRRFYVASVNTPLSVETTSGTAIVTRLGTFSERTELEQMLNSEFMLPSQPQALGALPAGWYEILSPECDAVLVKDPVVRSKQARTTWIACAGLALIPAYLLAEAQEWSQVLGTAFFFAILSGAAAWGATWLSFGRNEWKVEKGRLLLQRRFRRNLTTRFEAVSLELDEDRSGDDGTRYLLTAVAAGAPSPTGVYVYANRKFRREIYSHSDDPTVARNFGVWLSQRCQVPFADRTTWEAKERDLAALKEQLAGSGRLGQLAARVIERLETPSRPRNDA